MSAPDELESLRGEVRDHLAEHLLDPVGGPEAAAPSPDVHAIASAPGGNGAFEVAGMSALQRGAIKAGMRLDGSDKRLDAALGRMTGGALSSAQIQELEDRALHAAKFDEAMRLRGIQDDAPIVVDPQQKAIIDRLMSQSGTDPLGRAAQAAYQRAWQNGQIKVGGN